MNTCEFSLLAVLLVVALAYVSRPKKRKDIQVITISLDHTHCYDSANGSEVCEKATLLRCHCGKWRIFWHKPLSTFTEAKRVRTN